MFIKIDFGVRQGSVLSPRLYIFAVYVDDIVTRLHASQHYFIVLYADDILIYAPSIQELQTIVNTCELEPQSIDMDDGYQREEILYNAYWSTSRY